MITKSDRSHVCQHTCCSLEDSGERSRSFEGGVGTGSRAILEIPEKRCRLGGPAPREEEGPLKLPLERPPKEEPLAFTKLPSLDGNSSPSSDVSRWFAANVCNNTRIRLKSCTTSCICTANYSAACIHTLHAHVCDFIGLTQILRAKL